MTFLELCQAVASEAGVAGSDIANVPATVMGQHGELGRIVRYVSEEWLAIQGRARYDFMLDTDSLIVIPAGMDHVAAGFVSVNRYDTNLTFHTPTGSNAPDYLDWLPWQVFRQSYDAAYLASQPVPTAWTVRPTDGHLFINATPPADLTVYVTRYRLPARLVNDGDEPTMPEDLQQLIVQRALVRYANFDEAGVMRQAAQAEVIRLEQDLRERCLPPITFGGTLLD